MRSDLKIRDTEGLCRRFPCSRIDRVEVSPSKNKERKTDLARSRGQCHFAKSSASKSAIILKSERTFFVKMIARLVHIPTICLIT